MPKKRPVSYSVEEDIILLRAIIQLRAHLCTSTANPSDPDANLLPHKVLEEVWNAFFRETTRTEKSSPKRTGTSLRHRFYRLLQCYASNEVPQDPNSELSQEREKLLERVLHDRASAYAVENPLECLQIPSNMSLNTAAVTHVTSPKKPQPLETTTADEPQSLETINAEEPQSFETTTTEKLQPLETTTTEEPQSLETATTEEPQSLEATSSLIAMLEQQQSSFMKAGAENERKHQEYQAKYKQMLPERQKFYKNELSKAEEKCKNEITKKRMRVTELQRNDKQMEIDHKAEIATFRQQREIQRQKLVEIKKAIQIVMTSTEVQRDRMLPTERNDR